MSTLTDPLNQLGTPVSTLRHLVAVVGRLSAGRLSSLLRSGTARSLARALTARRGRPWLALVAVPLGMVAATVALQLWWDVPLALLAWRWAPADDPHAWLLGIMEACFGVQWAYIGATCLAAFPTHQLLVGILWIAYAGLIATVGWTNRRRYSRKYGW